MTTQTHQAPIDDQLAAEIAAQKAAADAVYAEYVREQDRIAALRYVVTLHHDEFPALGSRVVWVGTGFWVAAQWAQSAAKSLITCDPHSYVQHTADNTTYSAYHQDHSKHGLVYILAGHVTIEEAPVEEQPAQPSTSAEQPAVKPVKLTEAQYRAIAEWQQRMGETMWFPHFIEAVFPRRDNRENALRRSVRRLVAKGRIFRQHRDGRVELLREPQPWQTPDDDLPF